MVGPLMSRPLIKGIRGFVVCHRVPPWIEESGGPVPATSPIRGDHSGRLGDVAGREPGGRRILLGREELHRHGVIASGACLRREAEH